ncbi:hypothetical protein MNBD_UNCLBAC01-1433 [hydrothermal vent metagenome]|uniref:Sulfur carrier protein ThiS n=1 Tax=hydrothermal vent metagenome TaxID=652676 RepID=A0A3B1DVZ9_9ZZZZ
MKLTVNAKEQIIDQETLSITELLKVCDVAQPDMVSVQLNGEFVNREDFEKTTVKDNDEIDFLYFMGGGK